MAFLASQHGPVCSGVGVGVEVGVGSLLKPPVTAIVATPTTATNERAIINQSAIFTVYFLPLCGTMILLGVLPVKKCHSDIR